MRSALTEQLAGAPAAAVERETTSAPIALLDDPAFPCLRYAKGEVMEAIPSAGFEQPDVASMSLPGTAPSSTLAPGMVCSSTFFLMLCDVQEGPREAVRVAVVRTALPPFRDRHGPGCEASTLGPRKMR